MRFNFLYILLFRSSLITDCSIGASNSLSSRVLININLSIILCTVSSNSSPDRFFEELYLRIFLLSKSLNLVKSSKSCLSTGIFFTFLPHFSASVSSSFFSKLSLERSHKVSNFSKNSWQGKVCPNCACNGLMLFHSALKILIASKSVKTAQVQPLCQE